MGDVAAGNGQSFRSSLALDHLLKGEAFFGRMPVKGAHRVGSWPSLRGLRGLTCGSCRFTALHTSPSRAARTRRSCPSCTFSGPRRARPRAGRPARQDPHHNHTGQNTAPYRRTARAAGGVGQRDRRAQGQRLQRRDAKALEHGGVQKQLAVLHERGVLGIGHIAG